MLSNCGYFKRYSCPDGKTGDCCRPYCHFGHSANPVAVQIQSASSDQPVIHESNGGAIADDDVPSYSTVRAEHFQGYHGYFASSSSPPPAVPKRPLLPTPPVGMACIVRPSQNVRRGTNQRPPRNNPTARNPPPKPEGQSSKPQKESNLNDLARDLAAINNEIERLQRNLASSSEEPDAGTDCSTTNDTIDGDVAPDDVPAYDPEYPAAKRARYSSNHGCDSASSTNNATDSSSDEQYRPTAGPKTPSKSPYKPTPIDELQKMGKSKNKLLKDSWIPANDSDAKPPKAVKPNRKLFAKEKTTASKSAALLEKKINASSVLDLFGEDSDGEASSSGIVEHQRKQLPKPNSIKAKDDSSEDIATIIDDLIAPAPSAKRKEKDKVNEKKSAAKVSDESGSEKKKKRVAQLSVSSVEATKKLRESGGERARGHLMTARQQLETRMAQLKKMEEEMNAKRKGLSEELQHKQDAQRLTQQPLEKYSTTQRASKKEASSAEIGTHPKGEKRVARVPKPAEPAKQASGRPTIPLEIGAKIPSSLRQQYLNLIVDEFLKFLPQSEAYQKALDDERAVYAKASSKAGYFNAIANVVKRIRDEAAASSGTPSLNQQVDKKPAVSHSAVIGGKQASKHTYTVGRSGGGAANASSHQAHRKTLTVTSDEFYESLLPFVLSIDQQAANGYPRPDLDKPGFAVYYKDEIKKIYIDDNELRRICTRCGKLYQLSPDGEYLSRDECLFHWGRAWKKRVSGMVESRYNCCQGDLDSAGCSLSQYHVSDCMPRRALSGYPYTKDWRNGNAETNGKVFALDCEMVYTTFGSELARVTVVDDQDQVIYERCVRPENTILDYNSRFSGLTEDILRNGSTVTLNDVHSDLAEMFTAETILIGHSLESDLRALKLIHDKVVDTAIVFPHRLGSPYKRALKTLAIEFLKRIIQDDSDGHDSKEDATTAMDLMKWRVKQDAVRVKVPM